MSVLAIKDSVMHFFVYIKSDIFISKDKLFLRKRKQKENEHILNALQERISIFSLRNSKEI